MDILIQDSWLREYLDTNAAPRDIQRCLSLCGPSVEKIVEKDGEIIYSIEITTNRVTDSASVKGIAREAAAILPRFGFTAKFTNSVCRNEACLVPTREYKQHVDYLSVQIESPILCPRFTTVLLHNVQIKPSSEKIVERLNKNGIRSLNNVVDITNYCMIETGQPMHVFDYDEIKKHKMILRESRKGETIKTLDDTTRCLPKGSIVIEDGENRLIDLCGVMGGFLSHTKNSSKNILLFVQTYDPVCIRKTCQQISFRTDAAGHFEKWVDPEGIPYALHRALELIIEEAQPEKIEDVIDIYSLPVKPKKVMCPLQKLYDYADEKIPEKEILSILNSLEIKSEIKNGQMFSQIPSFRNRDIEIPEDIIEEVVRVYGYHNLKGKLPEGELPMAADVQGNSSLRVEQRIKELLKETNFIEVYTLSMLSSNDLENINYPCGNLVEIQNPLLTDENIMRPSLLPSLLKVVSENLSHEKEMAIFEMSNVYLWNQKYNSDVETRNCASLPEEKQMLGIVCVGHDFFEIKGKLEYIFSKLGIPFAITNVGNGRDHSLRIGKFGSIQYLKTGVLQKYNIMIPILYIELDVEKICADYSDKKSFKPVPKFPEAYEDLCFIVPDGIYYSQIEELIKSQSNLISQIKLIDEHKDTMTLRVIYQSEERNINDEDIKNGRMKILTALKDKFYIMLK